MTTEWIVVSVGGSLIVPESIDRQFLSRFKEVVLREVATGKKFAIITGGGRTARNYQHAAEAVSTLDNEDKDWLGIHATRLNGHLMRTIFRENAHPVIVKHPTKQVTTEKPILIIAGWKPGRSTDYVAVKIAKQLTAKKLVNLSNIDYVFDKDPKQFNDAKPIEKTDWKSFRKLIPKKWDPGLSSPFDPIAAREAEKLGLEVAIINGSHLAEFEKYLEAKEFTGTVIS